MKEIKNINNPKQKNKRSIRIFSMLLCICILTIQPLSIIQSASFLQAYAATKPTISSEAAILFHSNTGEVLFGQNENKKYYPASITKIMTALLVLERAGVNDTVVYSKSATTNLESGAVTLSLSEGDKVSVKDSLYGLMLKSANDVANGLAEHVSGSVSAFAKLMNERAKSLGANNTNFANPHGLNSDSHLTTAKDMALITREAVKNPTLRAIMGTTSYTFPAVQKAGVTTVKMGHKMLYASDSRYYKDVIGGKTGYTSKAGNTLVTVAERGGQQLIVVILKSKNTHYADTKALLDYGFAILAERGIISTAAIPATDTASTNTTTTQGQVIGPGAETSTSTTTNTNTVPSTIVSETVGPASTQVSADTLSGPGVAETRRGWIQDNKGWYYIKDNGSRAKSEICLIGEYDYWFDVDGYMATGFRKDSNGYYYYLRDFGGMRKSSWQLADGKWYYFGADGKMFVSTITPDGYSVGADGAWVQ